MLPKTAKPAEAPLAYPVPHAARIAGVSRDTLYRAMAKGELIARKIGSRTVILDHELRVWLAHLPVISPRS